MQGGEEAPAPPSDPWTSGYTQAELDAAQETYGLAFPPDLIDLLRDRRPAMAPDWRTDDERIRGMLAWPLDGLLFDVEQNELWWPEWGERPAQVEARREVVAAVVAAAPPLVPIFSHRFLPTEPLEAGNPVFSIYQSDAIIYGVDLADYVAREFEGLRGAWPHRPKAIRFWSELAASNNLPPEG